MMRIPQIITLMVLFCGLYVSCRHLQNRKDDTPKEQNTPSADEHENPDSAPEKDSRIPDKNPKDSILKRRKQSKDLDTLKPKMAMMGFYNRAS